MKSEITFAPGNFCTRNMIVAYMEEGMNPMVKKKFKIPSVTSSPNTSHVAGKT